MATPPVNTYGSATDLSLGHVPPIDDPILYQELLDIHNAIETLLTGSDDADAIFTEFIAKYRRFSIPPITDDYTVLITDGTVRVDASGGDITITMHPIIEGLGYTYNIKRIDLVTSSKVTIVGDGPELIDGRANGINLSTKSSYQVKTHDTGWDII